VRVSRIGERNARVKAFGKSGFGEKGGAFRIIYVAKFEAAVYVWHCFQKKTQATPEADLALAGRRYRELTRELSA
jgi:phage-related protein